MHALLVFKMGHEKPNQAEQHSACTNMGEKDHTRQHVLELLRLLLHLCCALSAGVYFLVRHVNVLVRLQPIDVMF